MKVQDFGQFDTVPFLFGGPYSNLQALEAFAEIVDDASAICTGDVVAYGANPAECVALIREKGWPVVAGNCERQIAEGADDCGCGFEDGTICDLASRGWYPLALAACDEEMRRWMRKLPDIGVFQAEGRRYGVIHGGVRQINRFLWPSDDDAIFREEIDFLREEIGHIDGVIAGHSGIAFHRNIDGCDWINAGAIGLPPHDGRAETRFTTLTNGQAIFQRLSYDHSKASLEMEAMDLVQGYQKSLVTGLWPSEDVLPEELQR